jgi:glutathione S-transferase
MPGKSLLHLCLCYSMVTAHPPWRTIPVVSLTLCLHPLASYFHKALIALYAAGTPFTLVTVDLMDPAHAAPLLNIWIVGTIPVLHDGAPQDHPRNECHYRLRVIPIFRHDAVDPQRCRHRHPSPPLGSFFNPYVSTPMQKIVFDSFRPEGGNDAIGVEEAKSILAATYGMAKEQLAKHGWAAG